MNSAIKFLVLYPRVKVFSTMKKIQKFQCLDFKSEDSIFFEKNAFYLELK